MFEYYQNITTILRVIIIKTSAEIINLNFELKVEVKTSNAPFLIKIKTKQFCILQLHFGNCTTEMK